MKNRWISLILAFVLLFGLTGCEGQGESSSSVSNNPISITAASLSKKFQKDQDAALKEYQGKLLEVTGKIKVASRASLISLDRENGSGLVVCSMADDNTFAMDKLNIGDVVRIRGELTGGSGDIYLSDCYCLKVVESNPVSSNIDSEESSHESSSSELASSEPPPSSSEPPASKTTPAVSSSQPSKPASSPTSKVTTPEPQANMVWISRTGKKYHSNPNCSNMKNPRKVTKAEAEAQHRTPCQKCY